MNVLKFITQKLTKLMDRLKDTSGNSSTVCHHETISSQTDAPLTSGVEKISQGAINLAMNDTVAEFHHSFSKLSKLN